MNLFFLCIKIFMARILDVSIGTIRTVYMVRGKVFITTILAFIEVYVWFWVAREALITQVNSILIPISYSLGYATGTFIGTYISNKFIKGIIKLEVISQKEKLKKISDKLKKQGYGISIIKLDSDNNDLLICQTNKKNKNNIIKIITSIDKNAFITINDTKYLHNGYIK